MLFQGLGKLKRSSIMTSIILMAVGMLMVMCPDAYVGSLVSVLGYAMVIAAAVWGLEFLSSKKALIHYIFLTGALLLALLGIAVLVREDIVRVIGLVFGLVLVGDGCIGIYNAQTYVRRAQRKGWWILTGLCGLLVLFGLIILINPWWDTPARLFDVIGGMLLFSSAVSIVRLIFIWPIRDE